jgi:hypothetical protein
MKEHRPKKLLDQVRDAIRPKHYSVRAEQTYIKRSPKQKAGAQHPVLDARDSAPTFIVVRAQLFTYPGIAAISAPSAPLVPSTGHPAPRSIPP